MVKLSIGLGILSALLSVVSVVIALYQHRQSLAKRLTVYIYGSRQVLSIDDSIAEFTKASFRGRPSSSVYGLRYLIENTGTKAIKDCVESLSVTTKRAPDDVTLKRDPELLDARVLHSQPEFAEVQVTSVVLSKDLTKTSFDFALLNKGDLFIVQLLFDAYVNEENLKFNIWAEDLPDTISPIYESIFLHNRSKPNRLAWWIWLGAVSVAILAVLAIAYFAFLSPSNLLGQRSWWAYVLAGVPLVLLLVALVAMLIDVFRTPPKRRRQSSIPSHLRWK